MKKLLALLLLLSSVYIMYGCGGDGAGNNGTVKGSVLDTGLLPIPGAAVTIGSISGATDSAGNYTLTSVPTGTQTISISSPGYISESRSVNVVAMDNTYVPAIVLTKRDSKSTTVGPGGGTVTCSDGTVTLVIPEGALSSEQTIVVTKSELTAAPAAAPSAYRFVSLVNITPADLSLSKTATLTLPFPSGVSSSDAIVFYYYDSSTSSWASIGSGTVNSSAGTVSIGITKFGWIAAAVSMGTSYGSVSGVVLSSTGSPIQGANVWTGGSFTVTDATGAYSFSNLPTGSTAIYSSAPGYNSNSVSVTIPSLSNVTAPNIVLTSSVSVYGTISGTIIDSSTSAPVQGAKIISGDKTTYSDTSGNYTLSYVIAGSAAVSVYAYGYVNQNGSVVVEAGKTATLNFSLDPVTVTAFSDDFETDKGWMIEASSPRNLWHRVNNSSGFTDKLAPTFVTLPDYATTGGAIPLAHGGSYSIWFGDDSTGCYIGDQQSSDTSLSGGTSNFYFHGDITSPSISLAGYSDVTLTFWMWYEIESMNAAAGFDIMSLKISSDGVNFSEITKLNPKVESSSKKAYLPNTSGGFNVPGIWVKQQYDLSSYAGKTIQIRFTFNTNDIKYNGFRGWFIDDVSVTPTSLSSMKISK